jgi:chorismate synthase
MSTFGNVLRTTTFGESHGGYVGCIVDGIPPQLPLVEADVQPQLDRRRPGQSALTSSRNEKDLVQIVSGTERGVTLGTPICMMVRNEDHKPTDYASMQHAPRPSHADFTYQMKYGVHCSSGGGRSSARETIGRVAAGAVAEKVLRLHGVIIVAWVSSVGPVSMPLTFASADTIMREDVDSSRVRCPDVRASQLMVDEIEAARDSHDSIGGVVSCVCRGVPVGLGEPCFDKLEAKLAHAMLSIPATKGFEIGSGFSGTKMRGSVHNDAFVLKGDGKIGTTTNNSGGVQGGISNGENIYFSVAFKPPATIAQPQHTVDYKGASTMLHAAGRHDPCIVPRAVAIVEAMAALVLLDALLAQTSRKSLPSPSDLKDGSKAVAQGDEVRRIRHKDE